MPSSRGGFPVSFSHFVPSDLTVMMPVLRAAGLVLAMVLLLGACGQKGPLFLPSEDPSKSTDQEPD
jgi:predicted small lipoprotein YifL